MRTLAMSLLVVGLLSGSLFARTWTSSDGKTTVEAEFVGMQEGKVLLRLAESGKLQAAPFEKFSAADQSYLKSLAGLGGEEAKQGAVANAEAAAAAQLAAGAGADRFSEAIAQNPTDPRNYYLRGLALTNRGKYAEAIADFNKALEMNPRYAEAYDGRGLAYAKSGEPGKAHEDFSRAIDLNPELAAAYRHRADNLSEVSKTEEGKRKLEEAAEVYHKKYNFADKANTRKSPWQPLNTTSGNMTAPPFMVMAAEDRKMAEGLEAKYGAGGGDYGVGYGGGGIAIGGPGVAIGGPGVVIAGPGVAVTGPPLAVYPEVVKQGETVTLVANAAAMQQGMPQKLGPNGRPVRSTTLRAKGANLEEVGAVEFYRDVDGDGRLNTQADKLLGTDADGKDGYSIEVPTTEFPPGPQAFFALPRGKEGGPNSPQAQALIDALSQLEKAIAAEREIAKAAAQAATAEGLSPDDAKNLKAKQEKARLDARAVYDKIRTANPDAAKALAAAAAEVKKVDEALAAAEAAPGEPSKAPTAQGSEAANAAADKMADAAAKLRALSDSLSAPAAGKSAAASAKIEPNGSKPAPAAVAGGPGGDGKDGDGKDGDGGDYVRDRVARDVVTENGLDRAVDYVRERDYDRAIEEYDRLLVDDPDNTYYLRDRAAAYVENGSYELALRDYDRMIVADEGNAELYYNRGCARLAVGEIDLAIADFTRSIELDETRNLAWVNRGTAYARKGEFERAIVDFTGAIKLNAADSLAYRNRALAKKKMGDMNGYEADMAKANELAGK